MLKEPAPLAVGIDLGTSAIKIIVLGMDNDILATAVVAFTAFSDLPTQAEQNPADWLAAVGTAMAQIDQRLRPLSPHWHDRVAAIGLTGQLPTLVCLGPSGPLGRAITWKDSRADHWAAMAISKLERRTLYERTGMPLDGRYLGPMYRYHWRERRDEIECILSAKDYLCYALTGLRVTDPSTAAGYGAFDLASGAFSEALCERWDLPMTKLPSVQPSHSAAGLLTAEGAQLLGLRASIPVTVGAADSVASAFAMAGLETGITCVTMGSSTIIIDAIRAPNLDPATRYLVTPHVEPHWYAREMDLLATGTGYRWLSSLFGWPDGVLDQRAVHSTPGARGIRFAPYLGAGEQGALWDPTLRGSIQGLSLQHTANDLARAFLEGVCFEIRRCVDVLAETAPSRTVIVTGHLVDHPSSLQMLADILRQPIRPFRSGSAAALGAAAGALCLIDPRYKLQLFSTVSAASTASAAEETQPSHHSALYQSLFSDYLSSTA